MTTAKVEQDGTNFSHLLQVKPFPNLEMAAKCVQPSPTTLFLDELPKIEIEEVFEHPVILAPGEHYPQTGERLLDAFLSAPKPAVLQQEVNQFVAAITAVNAASFASRRTSRQRRRESLQAIWSPLVKEEHMVYENILDDKIFIEREKAGYKMHPESCQYLTHLLD
jgi:hypothetical protein